MEKVFNWCFVGTGKLANKVAKVILSSGHHKIVSCYTRNYEKCCDFANKFHAKPFKNAEDAIRYEGVDAVYVVTPHNAHYRFAKLALENKIPVLCEKAFTMNKEEAKDLIELAKKNYTYLCEAMWTWFNDPALKVKEWVKNNSIGKIDYVFFNYHLNSKNYAPRVADPKRGGGALLDITVYPIAFSYYLFGYPKNIIAKATIGNGIDLIDDITFKYDDFDVDISASIVDFKGLEKIKIVGKEGKILSRSIHCPNKVKLKTKNRKEIFKYDTSNGRPYLVQFDIVASEIREGLKQSKYIPLKNTYDIMEIMDEIRSQIGLVYDNLE